LKFWLSSGCCHLADSLDVVPLDLNGKKPLTVIFNNTNSRNFNYNFRKHCVTSLEVKEASEHEGGF
jgi:hypothetical protein